MAKKSLVPPVISDVDLRKEVVKVNKLFGYAKYIDLWETIDVKLKRNMFGRRKGQTVQLQMFGTTFHIIRGCMSYLTLINPSDFIEGRDFEFV